MADGGGGSQSGDGDWACPNVSCINHSKLVFARKATCPKCGAPRSMPMVGSMTYGKGAGAVSNGMFGAGAFGAGRGAGMFPSPGFAGVAGLGGGCGGGPSTADWQCSNQLCVNHRTMVFGRHDSCPKCGTAKNAREPGDWQCPNASCVNNRNTVFARKTECPKCGTARPLSAGAQPPPRHPGAAPGQGVASFSPYAVAASMALGMTGAPPHFGGGTGDWKCPNASCMNHTKLVFARHETCPKCGAAKGPQGDSARPGDWQCPNEDCINHRKLVFAKNDSCPKCGEARRTRSRSPRGASKY